MRKNKLLLLLEFCSFLCVLKGIFYSQIKQQREENVTHFFQEKNEYGLVKNAYNVVNQDKEKYIGILEIPTLRLKVGFFSIESPWNTVEYGLQVIASSKMPDERGNFIIASHSGTSTISYFKSIHTVNKGDLIYVYYGNRKYIYQVISMYEEKKDGFITLPKVENFSLLTLTTCKGENQLLIISKQIGFEDEEQKD